MIQHNDINFKKGERMKICVKHMYAMSFLLLFSGSINAVSLDGTSSLVYKTNHHVFHDQDTTQGFVDLCKGFTIVPVSSSTHGANVYMDTNVSVSGAIDLRGTNTLTLLRNLYLDNGVTFSDSGKIYSYGNALIMNGDLTIPVDKVLHCGGNLIIEGKGHTLHIANGAQIFLDNSSTLTLRNMIIETSSTSSLQQALNISSTLSKLALDNVVLALGADLPIKSGQLFFHNDVIVTGTSALIYRSIAPSYIAPHGCLMLDNGTTFSYAPFTNNRDLIVLSDASSTLLFNGSSLLTTHTGLRLSKGRLFFDNKATINGTNDSIINTTTPINVTSSNITTQTNPLSCVWSPNSKYIALVNYNDDTLQVFSQTGGVLKTPAIGSVSTGSGVRPNACAWSPDSKYISAVNVLGNTLRIFAFSGASPTSVGSIVATGAGTSPSSCSWSPDGRYIAVTNSGTNTLQVYIFSGGTPVKLGSSVATNANPQFCSWSPDGKYIVVVNATDAVIQIYTFSGSTPVPMGSYASTYSYPYYCAWSPNGKYIAVTSLLGNRLQVFSCPGGVLNTTAVGSISTGGGSNPQTCSWSPDGRYIVVANNAGKTIQIYAFANDTDPSAIGSAYSMLEAPTSCAWSPDGNYMAATISGGGTYKLQVVTVNYLVDTSNSTLSNCITFGNGSLGSTYNLDVHILAGAWVGINGKVFDDPA